MQAMRRRGCAAAVLLIAAAAAGCTGYRLQDVAKTDMDYVADTHQMLVEGWLKELTVKLYKRNPRELRKGAGASVESRVQLLFAVRGPLRLHELGGRHGIAAMQLAFDDRYTGDRVLALMAGLTDMLRKSYGYRVESFMLDELNAEVLFKSARNVEVMAWLLNQRKGADGQPLLLANEAGGAVPNLSFERLVGKLVATQDSLAEVAAKKNRRTLSRAAQGVVSFVFFPI